MSIKKFVVNGDEAKVDYEGIENIPEYLKFGEETSETIIDNDYSFTGEN